MRVQCEMARCKKSTTLSYKYDADGHFCRACVSCSVAYELTREPPEGKPTAQEVLEQEADDRRFCRYCDDGGRCKHGGGVQ